MVYDIQNKPHKSTEPEVESLRELELLRKAKEAIKESEEKGYVPYEDIKITQLDSNNNEGLINKGI